MDWDRVIERNREALKRIVASLVAMAGLRGRFAPEAQSCRAGGTTTGGEGRDAAGGSGDPAGRRAESGEGRPTLPRHLHRTVLRLLRPAEAAARRLVIVAARDLVVTLPPVRPRKPDPKAAHAALRSLGIAIVLPHNIPHPEVRSGAEPRRAKVRALSLPKGEPRRTPARKLTLPLFDPIRTPQLLSLSKGRPRHVPAHAAPRILSFDGPQPHRLPPPPSPDDLIDASRVTLRLQALASALDDLPAQARRFARWRSRRAAARARQAATPVPPLRSGGGGPPKAVEGAFIGRISPLRPGRPPGLTAANRRRPAHEVHEVLGDLHHFALKALQPPDTS